MKNWKRNAVIAGLLVLACAGVYLNWLYGAGTPELTETLNSEKIMDDATFVLAVEENQAQQVLQEDSAGDYFAQMRLSRQTARDEAVTVLQETIAYAGGENTADTSRELESIISDALAESQIESMVIAKGYTDCVAYISDDGISLAVASPESGMTETDVSLLADIVMTQTEYGLSDIRIIPVE